MVGMTPRKMSYVWWWLGTCYEKLYLKPFCLVMSLFKPLGDLISLGLTKPPNIQVLKVLFVYHKIHPKGFGTSGIITFLDHSANNNPCFSAKQKEKKRHFASQHQVMPFPRHCTLQLLQETTLGEAETDFRKNRWEVQKRSDRCIGDFFFRWAQPSAVETLDVRTRKPCWVDLTLRLGIRKARAKGVWVHPDGMFLLLTAGCDGCNHWRL